MSDNEILDVKWAQADRISDRIIDLINAERRKPGFSPMQMMAGQMLAILGFMRTAPAFRPQQITDAQAAVEDCLKMMFEASKRGDFP
jgi:hypothetical protein